MLGHWGGIILAACVTHGIRVEAAISGQLLSLRLLDDPTADLQELGQSPLATPIDRPARMNSRCCSVRLAVGRGNGLRPSDP